MPYTSHIGVLLKNITMTGNSRPDLCSLSTSKQRSLNLTGNERSRAQVKCYGSIHRHVSRVYRGQWPPILLCVLFSVVGQRRLFSFACQNNRSLGEPATGSRRQCQIHSVVFLLLLQANTEHSLIHGCPARVSCSRYRSSATLGLCDSSKV